MSSMASEFHPLHHERLRSFVFPREHGAWGMLLVPFMTGAWIGFAGGRGFYPLILFLAASLALFCLRTPLEIWLQTSPLRAQTPVERQAVAYSIFAYAALATAAVGILLGYERAYGLLALGAVVGVLFGAQAILKKLGRQTRMTAQLIGSLGLTSTAAGAYYVVAGQFDSRALVLWGANWLFAANQIHSVQVRIHSARAASRAEKFARGNGFLAAQVLTILLLAAAWRLGGLPGAAALAFAPSLIRGFLWFLRRPAPLEIYRLGYGELANALIFGVLFILGFQLGV
ncbi:MAG: YwiC-like family protein [Terriglobia bacterium]